MNRNKKLLLITSIIIGVILALVGGNFIIAQFLDDDPPKLISVGYNKTIDVNDSATIQIFADDVSGIKYAMLFYRINDSTWSREEMKLYVIICCPPRYLSRIGPFTKPCKVEFYFELSDKKGNIMTSDSYFFNVVDQ
ncbi:MAG: hypothetical protein ACTSW1_07130 [Candidatus Hodarchaeales archaeon]